MKTIIKKQPKKDNKVDKKQPKKDNKGKKQLSTRSKILLSTLVPISTVFVATSIVTPIVINNHTFKLSWNDTNKQYASSKLDVRANSTYKVRIVLNDNVTQKTLKFNNGNHDVEFEVVSLKINHTAQEKDKGYKMENDKQCSILAAIAKDNYIVFEVKFKAAATLLATLS